MDTKGLWQAVLGELEVNISRANFATWFKDTALVSNEDGHVIISVPNIFNKEWLEKKYHTDIQAALSKINNSVKSIEYRVGMVVGAAPEPEGNTPEAPGAGTAVAAKPVAAAVSSRPGLNERYTFNDFVVGSSNQLAYAAATAVAANPGQKYNPLFIYGGVGLGKTHLIQAIGNEIRQKDPSKKVEYVTSERFTNEFVSSISRKQTEVFADKYRNIDVLIIDDMQFLAGKEKTQEEFFHTFNTLHQANKQIIISSDKPPKAIPTLEERLKSRFSWGMTADIQPPDLETRSAILQKKAASQGFMVPQEVIDYLAKNIQSNIRELEGGLTQLIAYCEFNGSTPSIALVTSLLGNLAANKPRLRPLSPRQILEKTAAYYDLKVDDILGPKRDKEIVVPRQIVMYLMRHEMNLSFPKIASSIGGRDHTTAMHSVSKIERCIETDESLRSEVNSIKERLYL